MLPSFVPGGLAGRTHPPTASRMHWKFWLLQALGWTPYALLQLLTNSDDRPLTAPEQISAALLLVVLAVTGSLLLRALYRRLQSRRVGELAWLALLGFASVLLALAVDLLYHGLIGVLAHLFSSFAAILDSQPALARAPLLLVMYVAWSLLYLALSRQQRLERAALDAQTLKLALKEAEVQRLLGQLSPHFIFNTLNNIRALILQDTEAARQLLTQFANTLRYQFADAGQAEVSVEEELRTVHDYLDLVRLQLGARLQYSEQIDPSALSLRLPRFSLQLLVENAIKHGLSRSAEPGQLDLSIRRGGDGLRLEVRNSGQLAAPGSGTGIGLANLAERLQLMYGAAATLELQQDKAQVLARLQIGAQH
jgi:hypothetical protein